MLMTTSKSYSGGDSNCNVPQNVMDVLQQSITISSYLYIPADTANTFCSILKDREHEEGFAINGMRHQQAFTGLSHGYVHSQSLYYNFVVKDMDHLLLQDTTLVQ